jgi:hypothetical protein
MKRVAALLLFLVITTACREDLKWKVEEKPPEPEATPAAPIAEATLLPTPLSTPAFTGRFRVDYPQMKTQEHTDLNAWLQQKNFPQNHAQELNEIIALPEDVTISVTECIADDGSNVLNAFYWKETRRIDLCIGFFESMANMYFDGKNHQEALTAGYIVFQFITIHEVGHALIDVLKLPITGREEDAVDQLAVFTLTDDDSPPVALAAGHYFDKSSSARSETFSDEHGFSKQRFFNFTCWVYGQNPTRFSHLINDGFLPQARAVRCEHEYQQIKTAWGKLLGPYIKQVEESGAQK